MARSKNVQRIASAAVQLNRQSTEQVSKSQSLTLVKNLVRVSISTVCHLRNIFPASCFQERSYAGMRIYQLDAATRDSSSNKTIIRNKEAYMLTQWLECGVFEAVERRYLRRMELLIVSPERNLPRESYSFDLDYPSHQGGHDVTFSGTKITTVENTKAQLIKLIRSLIQFSNTLEEVPSERIINMKLWYFDERTPPDWEPKHFTAADPNALCFTREADHDSLRIRIGELCTPHHTLKVRFKGVDTTLEADRKGEGHNHDQSEQATAPGSSEMIREGIDCDDESVLVEDTVVRSKPGNFLACTAGPDEEDEEVDEEEQTSVETSAMSTVKHDSVSGMMTRLEVSPDMHGVRVSHDTGSPERMDTARAWVLTQAKPSITGLAGYLHITRDNAREYMQRLVREGMLTKDSNHRYHRIDPPHARTAMDSHRAYNECGSGGDAVGIGDGIGDGHMPSSQTSSASDDSATQVPNIILTQPNERNSPSSMPPPDPPGRRGLTPEARNLSAEGNFVTPPISTAFHMPGLPPIPEKQQHLRALSMGTKRVLDDAALAEVGDSPHSDPIDVFNPPTGTMDSASTLGYEVSLSQASSSSTRVRKCSLALDPIRQSGTYKKVRLNGKDRQ